MRLPQGVGVLDADAAPLAVASALREGPLLADRDRLVHPEDDGDPDDDAVRLRDCVSLRVTDGDREALGLLEDDAHGESLTDTEALPQPEEEAVFVWEAHAAGVALTHSEGLPEPVGADVPVPRVVAHSVAEAECVDEADGQPDAVPEGNGERVKVGGRVGVAVSQVVPLKQPLAERVIESPAVEEPAEETDG